MTSIFGHPGIDYDRLSEIIKDYKRFSENL